MQEEKTPKVSVCVVTYNQKKYIRQCLQSIVDQETDFDFEVIVGDDCSTDGTRAIVQEFAERYPEIIKPIFREKNIGGSKNYISVHQQSVGEYVAHCDGDDWVCPSKLIKQSRYLDAHSECTLVAHRMAVWDAEKQVSITMRNSQSISLPALLHNHPMFLNSSIMYRRDKLSDVFVALNSTFIDFYVYVAAAMKGDIGFINEVLGNYRRNIGISSKRELMPYIQAAIDLAASKVGETPDVLRCRSRQYLSYAVAALCANEVSVFRSHLLSSIKADSSWIMPKLIFLAGFTPKVLKLLILMYKNRWWA